MKENRMSLPVFIAQPGSEENMREKGLRIDALVDSGADISIVPTTVSEQVYDRKSVPYGFVEVFTLSGRQHIRTVPLTIGVETSRGNLICVQIDCLVSEQYEITTIGNDVLTQLGLKVTLDYKQKKVLLESYNWMSFEEEVAAIYRSLGATVKQNVNLAGLQIDMVVEETTPSKQHLRIAVECKFYKDHVGNRIVNDFSRVVQTLKQSGLIDKGIIVSSSGFTQDARLVAEKMGIDLITVDDLKQAISDRGIELPTVPAGKPKKPPAPSLPKRIKRIPRIFIIMPFTPELDDVYHLGIREVVAKVGGSCERADEMQHVGGIVEKIYDSIKGADIIIAELTAANPNVYYEVGFAHALGKPVILLTRNIQNTPFDLRVYNHVIYSSIVDLRERLDRMLSQIMNLKGEGEK
jgi:hypothetical protein